MTFESRMVSVRNGMFRVEVRSAGAGDPLVCLHGAGGAQWDGWLDSLAERFTVYQPVHPGWGASEGLDHLDDVLDMTIFYFDLFDALGLSSFHLLGHSLGGMFAAEIAALDPSYVRKLVLSNPVGLWLDDALPLDIFVAENDELTRALYFDAESAARLRPQVDPDDKEAVALMAYERQKALAATGKFVWPIWDKGLKKRLHRIKAPTLIVWGEKDGLIPHVYGPEFQKSITGSQLAVIPQTAHIPMLERPAEFVRVVREFLNSLQEDTAVSRSFDRLRMP